ncbi:MAG: multiheme c-type cytochrome [Pseudomonadota bacterium]|nr:multiheme c-type cytochrome [Pseudomonadota bacterium]
MMTSLKDNAPQSTIICGNLAGPPIPGIETHKIFTINNKKVLVTAIIDPALERKAIHGLQVKDPLPTLEKILETPHDLAIAVLHFSDTKARRLIRRINGLDVAILGTQRGTMKESELINGCRLVKNNNHGKTIGYLDWDFTTKALTDAKIIQVKKELYKADQKIANLVSDYELWLRQHYVEVEKSKEQTAADLAAKVPYVGSHTCATCHPKITASWKNTRHARAYASLQKKCKDFCPDCLPCHVTGSREHDKQGFRSPSATPDLFDIQCEECHGPAEEHIKKPDLPYGLKIESSTCTICHTANTDPEFSFEKDLNLISH